jgi:hypothetical protein
MRFAAVPPSKQPPRIPAAELIRRLVTGESLARLHAPDAKPQDLPSDLDQRVRLVGEW